MVCWSSKPNKRLLIEGVVVIIFAIIIYFSYGKIYDITIPENQPDAANIFPLVVVIVFCISYVLLRWRDALRKAKYVLTGWPFKVGSITTLAGLVLIAGTYSYPMDMEQTQEVNMILRSETTGDVWVIEAVREDNDWTVEVERDTVYLASATIIALATFGSLVTVRFFGSSKTLKPRTHGTILMFGGVMLVIVSQSFLMYGACCASIDTRGFIAFFVITAVALASIAVGIAKIIESQINEGGDHPSTLKQN